MNMSSEISKMTNNGFTPLQQEDEDILEKNLVWIFGAGRSGTTWLGKELLSYKTHFIDEPYIGRHLQFLTGKKKILESHKKRDDYFFSNAYKSSWKLFLRKLILNRIYSQIQDLETRIIIKEPHGTMGSGIISDCLPNSKIVVVIRDGRDTLDSEIDANSAGGWSAKERGDAISSDEQPQFIKRYSKNWVNLMGNVLDTYQTHQEGQKILVRYEELRTNTVSELTKIYDFLEIDIDENNLKNIVEKFSYENAPKETKGPGKSRRSATPGKWKENLSEDEQSIAKTIMGDTLKKLGYSV